MQDRPNFVKLFASHFANDVLNANSAPDTQQPNKPNKHMTKTQFAALVGSLAMAGSSFAGTAAPGKQVVPPMPAAEELLGFTLSAGYDSAYLFHGTDVGENLLWQKLEFSKALNDKVTLSLGQWYGHLFEYEYNELDLFGGLTYNAGPINIGVGFTWYHYFQGSALENQYEPSVTISSNGLPVNIYATYFYDFEVDGSYIEAGISKSIPLCASASLDLSANVGYNIGYNTDEDGFNHVGVRVGLPIALSKTATLTPYIAGNFALDATEGYFAEDNLVLGGVSIAVKF